MASDAPMKLRRRMPGMPLPPPPPLEAPDMRERDDGQDSQEGQGKAVNGRPLAVDVIESPVARKSSGPERLQQSSQARDGGDVNPYAGAGTTSLNVRILVPLHNRYRKLVRELEDERYRSSATELFHALLHFGPSDTDEARELLRRWRALLDSDPPR